MFSKCIEAVITRGCVFILTTNHFEKIEIGVRSRCHCIPFNAAPPEKWLPLAQRIMNDAGLLGISDEQLTAVIQTGKGSARDITDALIDVILEAKDLQCMPLQQTSTIGEFHCSQKDQS